MILKESLSIRTFAGKNHKQVLISVFILFAVIFSLTSFINHYQFRTYALDLGMYNQAVYSYSHFKQALFTLGIDGRETPFLGTHFSIITILYSPLYYLFGSYTLLFIQTASILLGGLGIYKYASERLADDNITPLIVLFQFFSMWGIYSALAFDYHDSVIGAMMVPWLVRFIEKRRIAASSVLLLLILFTKEVMAFWVLFILIGLMIKNRRKFKKEYLKFELPAVLFCIAYGIAVTVFIMPLLQGSETNLQLARYSHLGGTSGEIFKSLIQKPQYLVSLLFENTGSDPVYNGIKAEFHLVALLSGGIFLLIRPSYLIMLIPVYAFKFLSNDYALWGINYHYSIEFMPIICLAITDSASLLKKWRIPGLLIITLITAGVSIGKLENRVSKWYNPQNAQFYNRNHYVSGLDLAEIYSAIKLIDRNAVVSGSPALVPHLAGRSIIYHFPVIKDAEYIALLKKNTSVYPLSHEEYEKECERYRHSDLFETLYDSADLLIIKRKDAGDRHPSWQ